MTWHRSKAWTAGTSLATDSVRLHAARAETLEVERFVPAGSGGLKQRLVRLGQWRARIAEAVNDRVAAVAPEVLQRHLHPRAGLAPLVLGDMQQALDPHHGIAIKTGSNDCSDRFLTLHQPLQDRIEHRIGRQRILVLLILAQLRGRLPGNNVI